jgi:nucleoside-diphosphate-sugar epimerase
MYGDGDGKPITETSPLHPLTRKGQARAEAAQAVLDAHQAGHVRAVIGRASDFYGPAVRDSTFGERMFGFAVQGKPADALGNLETPHSVTFIQDFGKGLVILGENESAYGQAWIVPTAPPVSQRQLLEWLFQELGQPYRVRAVGKMMLRVAGLFLPEAKESVEMMYEFEKPFLVDSSKFTRTFGAEPVPLREGVRQTVAWYRRNLGANNRE